MKLRNLEIMGIVLAVLVTAAILVLTTPYEVLLSCRALPLIASAAFCALSLLLRCLVWVLFVLSAPPSATAPGEISLSGARSARAGAAIFNPEERSRPPRRLVFAVSVVSLVGMITPLSLGIDMLRTIYGRRRLQLSVAATGAASVLTREFKLRVSLVLAASMALCAILFRTNLLKAAVLSVTGLCFVLLGFCSLRSEAVGRFAKRLKIGDVSHAIKALLENVGRAGRLSAYAIFALAFLLEWISLHLCFLSLGLRTSLPDTFVVFVIQYFLSKTPVLPQGVGAVETGAFVLLRSMSVPIDKAGALLAVWNCLRILTPPVLAAAFLPEMGKRRTGVRPEAE